MHWTRLFLLLIASLPPFAAFGQALTFDEAVTLALDAAPQVRAGAESATAMRELVDSAGRLPDPALVVGVDNLPVEGADAWSTTGDFMTMRTIGLMQEFPRGEKRRLARDRASEDVSLADAELLDASLGVARDTARAWIRRATYESTTELLVRLRPEIQLTATAARAGVTAGRVPAADALAAASAVVRLDTRILDLQGKERQARAELARWIGDAAERPLGPLPLFDALPAPAAVLLEDSGRHGAILPFDARIEAARTDVEIARAERRPDWSAELSFEKRGPEFDDMASFQLTIGLPLFTKHRQNPAIAARNADLRRMEAEREAGLRAHAAELKQMLIEWEQSGAQLERFDRELLPLARERSRAALAAYRSGGSDLRFAVDALEDEIELLAERADLANTRGQAWAYLRFLESRQLPAPRQEDP